MENNQWKRKVLNLSGRFVDLLLNYWKTLWRIRTIRKIHNLPLLFSRIRLSVKIVRLSVVDDCGNILIDSQNVQVTREKQQEIIVFHDLVASALLKCENYVFSENAHKQSPPGTEKDTYSSTEPKERNSTSRPKSNVKALYFLVYLLNFLCEYSNFGRNEADFTVRL